MNAVQHHRGPDDAGSFHDQARELSMAMRRLSIVDLEHGHQPMTDAGQGLVIVFNGEIFNASELRSELQRSGQRFNTDHSDTEVVLHLYKRDGARCVDRLNGMFAFAIFDRARNHIFLARDRCGIKPLFYSDSSRGFAFASELKSISQSPGFSREVDPVSLGFYLSMQFTPPEQSIFSSVKKLPAGHSLTVDIANRAISLECYWNPKLSNPVGGSFSSRNFASELRAYLESAVSDWVMSDVPIGASLSGGIDSSVIVGLLASKGHKLKTWTLGFSGQSANHGDTDERQVARAVAARWGTEHHEIVLDPVTVLGDLEEMVSTLDEPYGGGLPSWYVFREMSQQVKVALTGTGGDELFGNYGKWKKMQLLRLGGLARLFRAVQRHGVGEVIENLHGSLFNVQFGEGDKKHLLNGDPIVPGVPSILEAFWQASGSRDPRQAVAYVDLRTQLPEEFLMMTDRFSMRWSVEARTPFLDNALVEYVLKLPPAIRNQTHGLKPLLIEATRDLLSADVMNGPKRGFVLPIATWLRGEMRPLVESLFQPDFLRVQGLFRSDLLQQIVEPFMAGRNNLHERIWTLVMFQLWWRKNLGHR